MTTFPSLQHFLSETGGQSLTLPLRGREYTWQQGEWPLRATLKMNAMRETLVKIAAAQESNAEINLDDTEIVLTEAEDQQLGADLIGPERTEQMLADGVTQREYEHVYSTVLNWIMWGEDVARKTWLREGGDARPPAQASGSTRTPAGSSKRTSAKAPAGPRSSTAGTSSKRASTRSTKST